MTPAAMRRVLHASSSALLLLLYVSSVEMLRFTLLGGAIAAILLDSMRVTRPAFGALIRRIIPVFRESESTRLSGATWLCIGYAIAVWFPQPAATAGVLTAALADPAASCAGSMLADPSKKKTWAGSSAAALVSVAVLMLLGLPLLAVAIGALTAMALERWPGPLNDNLVVAPGVAVVVWLLL
jgi:dolichol kinase